MMNTSPHVVQKGMKAVVIGTGRSGQAAAKLLHSLGASVRIVDRSAEHISESFQKIIAEYGFETAFGPHSKEQFEGAQLIIPSPGVPVLKLAEFLPDNAEVLAEVELAWSCVSHIPTIAVTGTNGKTTTVRLCEAMLREAGKRVFLGGNIGTPLSEFVLQQEDVDVLVLEVSSFQLQTCKHFCPTVGLLLNVTEDHLDYHQDMREYFAAKMRMFANMGPENVALMGEGVLAQIRANAHVMDSINIKVFRDTGTFADVALKGEHNRLNMEAAFAATSHFGVTLENALAAVERFAASPHTLETVCNGKGVTFVNDSKATTVDSVRAALESIDSKILLLAGGHYKGGDVSLLNELVKQKVRAVGLFGESRKVFEDAWGDLVPCEWHATMEESAAALMEKAQDGDVMLLSPATSSFDQYASYKERGEDFVRIARFLCK